MVIMVNARVKNLMPITCKEMAVFALANKLKVYIEGNNIIVHKLLINLRMKKYMVKKIIMLWSISCDVMVHAFLTTYKLTCVRAQRRTT